MLRVTVAVAALGALGITGCTVPKPTPAAPLVPSPSTTASPLLPAPNRTDRSRPRPRPSSAGRRVAPAHLTVPPRKPGELLRFVWPQRGGAAPVTVARVPEQRRRYLVRAACAAAIEGRTVTYWVVDVDLALAGKVAAPLLMRRLVCDGRVAVSPLVLDARRIHQVGLDGSSLTGSTAAWFVVVPDRRSPVG